MRRMLTWLVSEQAGLPWSATAAKAPPWCLRAASKGVGGTGVARAGSCKDRTAPGSRFGSPGVRLCWSIRAHVGVPVPIHLWWHCALPMQALLKLRHSVRRQCTAVGSAVWRAGCTQYRRPQMRRL
jgi:hypothetical protein